MSLEKHTNAASNAGFQYQFLRMLLALAKGHRGDSVGIENLDDVSIVMSDGNFVLEQDKISLQNDTEIFDNRSKNLWNSLSIWISAVKSQEIDVNKTIFLLATNKKCHSSIILEIAKAKTNEDAEKCISLLRTEAQKPTNELNPLMDNVLSECSLSFLRQLIVQIELVDAADPASVLMEIGQYLPVPSSVQKNVDEIISSLLGWVQKVVINAWFTKQPARITHDAFITQIYAVVDSLIREKYREKLKHLIKLNPADIAAQKEATFVKQLDLISDESDLITESIENYLRCKCEKTRLSLEGEITDDEWIDFDNQLYTRWETSKRRITMAERNKSEKDQGFSIFLDLADYKANLAGVQTTQLYLSQGTLHRMADEMRIGWHPRYKELLK